MKTGAILRASAGVGVVLAAGLLGACHDSDVDRGRVVVNTFAAAAGSQIPDNDPVRHPECLTSFKSQHVAKLYLGSGPNTLLSSLASGSLSCINCLTYSGANNNGDDEEPKSKQGPLARASTLPIEMWPTPYDIDIYGNKLNLWTSQSDTTPNKPVLIKIILVDSSLQFYGPNDGNGTIPSKNTDSKWAVVAAGDNPTMLVCRGPVVKADLHHNPPILYDYVTVKVRWRGPSTDGTGIYTAINVGVITKQAGIIGQSGNYYYMPVYLDPNVKSNG